jgi:cbb3-type cytochrome oxidase subunit 1
LEAAVVTNYTALLYSLDLMNLILLVGVDCLEVVGFYQPVKMKPLLVVPDLKAELIEYMYFGELINLNTSAVFASSLVVASSGST